MNGPSFQGNSQKSGPTSQNPLLPLPSRWISWFYLLSLKSVQTCHLVSVLTTPALIQAPFISCLHYWNCPYRSAGFPFSWSPIHSPYHRYHQLKIIFCSVVLHCPWMKAQCPYHGLWGFYVTHFTGLPTCNLPLPLHPQLLSVPHTLCLSSPVLASMLFCVPRTFLPFPLPGCLIVPSILRMCQDFTSPGLK